MKTLFTLLLSFIYLISYSQDLELDFAHRFGIIENDRSSAVTCVKYYENEGKYLVAGGYNGQIDIGINSTNIQTTEDGTKGFVAIYDENFDLLHHFITGSSMSSAELMGDQVVTCGRFGAIDVDLNDDQNEIIESLSSSGNGYIATYDLEGNYLWHKIFSSEVSNQFFSCSSYQDNIYLIHSFSINLENEPLTFSNGNDEIALFNENGSSTLLLAYDSNGLYQFHHQYKSDEDNILPSDFEIFGSKLYLSLNVRQGTFDVGLTEPFEFEFERFGNGLVLGYDLFNLGLIEYYSFNPANDDSIAGDATFSKTNSQEIVISTTGRGEISSLNHTGAISQEFSSDVASNSSFFIIYNYNSLNNIIYHTTLFADEYQWVNQCIKINNGDVILSIEYEGELYRNDELVEDAPEEERTYALMYLNSQLNSSELFNYESISQSELDHDILLSPLPGSLLVAGNYVGNHDVDFSENTQSLGNVLDDLNGFISTYNFDPESSIIEIIENNLSVYPNPAKNQLTINLKGESFKNSIYSIYDLQGKQIKQGLLNFQVLDVSNLSKGTYKLVLDGYMPISFVKL